MSDRLTNPIEGGYDIAISVDMPRGASANLVARKLNSSRRIRAPHRIIYANTMRSTRQPTS